MTKDELIEKYRYVNVDSIKWWDSIYSNFKEQMTTVGIEVHRIYFSGFHSQGDGACFEGRVYDWKLFLKSLGYEDDLLIQHAAANFVFSCHHKGYYYHERSVLFNVDVPFPTSTDDYEFVALYYPGSNSIHDIRTQAWLSILNKYSSSAMEEEFTTAFRDYMEQLYEELAEEYEHLIADETVWEELEDTELMTELDTE